MYAGLTSVTFRKASAQEIVKFAAQNSLEYIEWGADVHARPLDTPAIDEIVSLCHAHGIERISYGSYYRAGQENEFSADEAIAAARRLGAKRIRVWAGAKEPHETDKDEFDAIVADLRNLVALAAKYGITVATEFHHGTYAVSAEGALRLISAVPNLRTYWQENPQKTALENLAELKSLLPYLETVHTFCFDADLNRYPLSAAKERWRAYIHAIKEASKSEMPFLLEFVRADGFEQAAEDAKTLREWLEGDCI